jgi:hypothetical protein
MSEVEQASFGGIVEQRRVDHRGIEAEDGGSIHDRVRKILCDVRPRYHVLVVGDGSNGVARTESHVGIGIGLVNGQEMQIKCEMRSVFPHRWLHFARQCLHVRLVQHHPVLHDKARVLLRMRYRKPLPMHCPLGEGVPRSPVPQTLVQEKLRLGQPATAATWTVI